MSDPLEPYFLEMKVCDLKKAISDDSCSFTI